MKKIIGVVIICAGLSGFMGMKNHYEDKMESFKWLIGSWTMNSNNKIIMETWRPMNDSSFDGESTMYNKTTTETVPLEKIRLVSRGKDFFYIPVAQGQNNGQAVEFKITSYSKKGFTAENPGHDFPKRITYALFKKDSLHAFIDGGPSMAQKKTDYYYSRIKKQIPQPVKK